MLCVLHLTALLRLAAPETENTLDVPNADANISCTALVPFSNRGLEPRKMFGIIYCPDLLHFSQSYNCNHKFQICPTGNIHLTRD